MTLIQAMLNAVRGGRRLRIEEWDGGGFEITLTHAPSMGAPYNVQTRVYADPPDHVIEAVLRVTEDMNRQFPISNIP